jgi:cobalt-precorrin 5A hydrolase / precorrin-3B C17-methyltransferase
VSGPALTLGIGADRGVTAAELASLVHETLKAHGLLAQDIGCVVSLDLKQDEPALHELAKILGVPTRFFDVATLRAETPRLQNPSTMAEAATGVPGIAEAAALAAAGPDSVLVVPKTKSARATCAIARRAVP